MHLPWWWPVYRWPGTHTGTAGRLELLHVADDQRLSREIVFDRPPAHQLTLADQHPQAAASQRAPTG